MQYVKSKVFNYLAKSQKTELCLVLTKFGKRNSDKEETAIAEKFIEQEEYYLAQQTSRNSWIEEHLFEDYFLKDLKCFIKDCLLKLKIKEAQKPLLEKQKQVAKETRKKLQEQKMSRESGTFAQIKYFKALSKKHNLKLDVDPSKLSKLELKNAISELIESTNDKEQLFVKLQKLKANQQES